MTNKKCYLCDKKTTKELPLRFFRFPKDPEIRKKWLHACDLTVIDDLNNIYICDLHFKEDGFLPCMRTLVLKPYAVPSVNVPNPSPVSADDSNPVTANLRKTLLINGALQVCRKDGTEEPLQSISSAEDGLVHAENGLELAENGLVHSENASEDTEPAKTENSVYYLKTRSGKRFILSKVEPLNAKSSENINIIDHAKLPKERRYFHPRYISEITMSDFTDRKKIKSTIKFIKQVDTKRKNTIASLRRKAGKLLEQVNEIQGTETNIKKLSVVSKKLESYEDVLKSQRMLIRGLQANRRRLMKRIENIENVIKNLRQKIVLMQAKFKTRLESKAERIKFIREKYERLQGKVAQLKVENRTLIEMNVVETIGREEIVS